MGVNVQEADPRRRLDWDERLAEDEHPCFFHSAAWARTLCDAYGFRPGYLSVPEGPGWRALLPVMEVRSWLTGHRGVALPFSDVCPLSATTREDADACLNRALELGRERQWRTVQFRCGRSFPVAAQPSATYYEHTLDLGGDPETLFSRLRSPVRTAIRHAQRSHVEITIASTAQALAVFERLNALTRRSHGLPPQPRSFFRAFAAHVLATGLGTVVLAHWQGRPVAGAVFVHLGPCAWYKYGAADERYQHLRSSNLVMWSGIEWHVRGGYRTLSLGRTDLDHEGLRRFKVGWGVREERLDYYTYDFRRGNYVLEANRVTGWHNRVFRHLPIALARAVSAVLYRHMG
jgi:hypothetical protein